MTEKPTRRNTWQKDAVKHALGEAIGFVSAQQLHLVLRNHGSTIGLATVYRALADLATSGDADSLQSKDGRHPPGEESHPHPCGRLAVAGEGRAGPQPPIAIGNVRFASVQVVAGIAIWSAGEVQGQFPICADECIDCQGGEIRKRAKT